MNRANFVTRFLPLIFSLALACGVTVVGAQALQTVRSVQITAAASAGDRLSIVQLCNPQGGKCNLMFVDTRPGEDVVGATQSYLARSSGNVVVGSINVQANCSPGWLASVRAEQGTVSSGGVTVGTATVCGYPDAVSALSAALTACNEQTFGICQNANRLKAVWGEWKGVTPAQRVVESGRPYDPMSYPDGQQCESTVPIYSTSSCLPQALSQLKAAGVR